MDFTKALEISPNQEPALINRGLSFLKMNKFEQACNDFQELKNSKKAENLYFQYCQ